MIPWPGSKLLRETGPKKLFLYPKYHIPHRIEDNIKRIVVIGQTGCGKTTWINSLINYHMEVTFETPIRYILVREEKKNIAYS